MLSSAPFIAELPQDLAGRTTSLFTVHGRYGNNALNGDWELGITSNTSAPPQQQSQRTWKSGAPESFTFEITKIPASLTAPAATSGDFTIGGSNVKASYTDIASYEPNAIKIWVRSTNTGSGVTIKDLKIKTPGVPGETVFPGTVINVSQDLGPVFQEIIIAGVDFKSSPSGSVTLEGTVAMQFGNAPAPRGSSVQFHVIATHIPWFDLDVDSNNNGDIDLTNGRRGTDDPIEDRTDLPGVIVPVGGTRTKMVVHVAAGRTATLAFAQGVDMVRVYAQETGGNPVLEQGNETTTIGGGPPQTFWIEAFAPSASLADIAFTLTADTNGPPVRDIVRATAVAVNLDVSPSKVDEDGSQGLIYTFTRSMALPTPLTISYDVVGGTATEGIDYTGLPLATGGRSITIPANATTASVAVFPIPDSEIEYDETVVLALLPGAGYGLGTRTVATGTILNDDLPGTVTGRGWFDANDDGSYSASESPLSGIIVNLFDSLGLPALDASLRPVAPTTIDAGATYRFPNLRPGSYTVAFTDTVGYLGPGTVGAVYAGVATVQLAQTAIVDLLFSQVVIPEEPPAPPAPPTADTLDWKDFEEVDTGKDPSPKIVAHTGWKLARTFPGRAFTFAAVVDQQGAVKATGRFTTPPNFRAVFNAADSWVVKGKQAPQLLEHERLHLRIAEYIAEKANLNFSETWRNITVDGVGQAANLQAAKGIAKAAASQKLAAAFITFYDDWVKKNDTITKLYDDETDHGTIPEKQTDWDRNWEQRVDIELKRLGWTK